jgi:hypothetical protein
LRQKRFNISQHGSAACPPIMSAVKLGSDRRFLRKIAEELADAGHLDERGRAFNAMSISRMLSN